MVVNKDDITLVPQFFRQPPSLVERQTMLWPDTNCLHIMPTQLLHSRSCKRRKICACRPETDKEYRPPRPVVAVFLDHRKDIPVAEHLRPECLGQPHSGLEYMAGKRTGCHRANLGRESDPIPGIRLAAGGNDAR